MRARILPHWLSLVGIVLCLMTVTALGLAQDKSAVGPTKLKLPSGPGSLEGVGENADVNLSMGLLTYAVPISVPEGYSGLSPSVGLSYSSSGGNSVVGIGWSIAAPSIERMTSLGLPEYTTEDRLAVEGSRELVRVDESGIYRERFEGSFVRYRWVDGEDGRRGYFIAEYPDGRVGYFGARSDGTLVEAARVEGDDGTFRYHLVEVVDALGHRLVCDYDKVDGHPLVARIGYVREDGAWRYEVRFDYEDRPDHLSDAKPGFELNLTQRLREIQILVKGQQVRRYALEYSKTSDLSRLEHVEWFGTDDAAGPYPIDFTFSYSSGFGEDCDGQDCASVQEFGSVPLDFKAGLADLVDLNGDALPDIVDTSGSKHRFYLNEWGEGKKSFSAPQPSALGGLKLSSGSTQMFDLNGDGFADMIDADSGTVLYNAGKDDWDEQLTLADLGMPDLGLDADARTVDVNNDGRIDVLHADAGSTWYYRNDGDGFSIVEEGLDVLGAGFSSDNLQLGDMNGDGMVDVVRLAEGLVSFRLNLGRGRWAAWREMANVPSNTTSYQLTDINGDALADLVRLGGTDVTYALNRNSHGFAPPEILAGSSKLPIPETDGSVSVRFADMNGNGTTDIVWISSSGAISFLEIFGQRPNLLREIDNGIGARTEIGYVSSVEQLVRDGGKWAYRLPHPMTVVDEFRSYDEHSGQVAIRRFRYRDGYYDSQEKQFRGFTEVEVTEPGDTYREMRVEQLKFDVGIGDPYRKDLLIEQRVFSDARPLQTTRSEYGDCDVNGVSGASPEVRFICPTRSVQTLQEGLDPSEWVTIEELSEFDAYGNQTLKALLGVTSIGGGACRSCSDTAPGEPCGGTCAGDEAYEETTFARPNAERWMLRLPIRKRTHGVPGSELTTDDRYYYDGEPFVGLAYGEYKNGLVSRTTARVRTDSKETIDTLRTKYNAQGAVVQTLDANGNRKLYSYDEAGLLLQSETSELDGYSLYMHVSHDPVLESIVRSSEWRIREGDEIVTPERPSLYAYDAFGRIVAVAQPGDTLEAPTQVFEYEVAKPVSRIVSRSRSKKGGDLDLWQADCFDGQGRGLGTLLRVDEDEYQVNGRIAYGAYGEEARIYEPFVAGTGDCSQVEAEENAPHAQQYFDAEGRILRGILPDADVFGTESERLTVYRPLEKSSYDEEDTSGGDYHDTPTIQRTDGLGRPIQYARTLAPSQALSAHMEYDELGRLVRLVDPRGTEKTQEYDLLGRVVAVNDPDAGRTTFEYDPVGNKIRVADARKVSRRFAHDALGRVIEEWDADDADDSWVEFAYDRASDCEMCVNGAGRLVQVRYPMTDGAGLDQYGYDERGNATHFVRKLDGKAFAFESLFDNVNRIIGGIYPGNQRLDYELDGAERVTKVPGYVKKVRYADNGGIATVTTQNDVSTTYEYDRRKRIVGVRTNDGEEELLHGVTIARDRIGNVTGIEAEGGPEHLPTASARFGFDALYRLTSAKLDVGGDFEENLEYEYDENDNLLRKVSDKKDESPAHVGRYEYEKERPNLVKQAGDLRLKYDAGGFLTERGEDQLTWDFMGRLSAVFSPTKPESHYEYGPSLSRVKKVEGEHVAYYFSEDFEVRDGMATLAVNIDGRRYAELKYQVEGPKLLDLAPGSVDSKSLEPDPDGAYEARDAWFGQALRAGVFSGADPPSESSVESTLAASARRLVSDPGKTGVQYFHHDHLGSVALVTDTEGEEIARFLSYPYGAERYTTGGHIEEARFTGQERDKAAGLVSFKSRAYEPRLARWTRPDPRFSILDPDLVGQGPAAWNRFAYGPNPVSAVDEDGELLNFVLGAVGGAVSGAIESVAIQVIQGKEIDWGEVAKEAAIGGAIGVATGGLSVIKSAASLGKVATAVAKAEKKVGEVVEGAKDAVRKVAGKKGDDLGGVVCSINSFTGDTLVETADGLRPIESIRVGDLVLAKDEVTGEIDWKPVVALIQSDAKPVMELTFQKANGDLELILATPNHPIWTPGEGFVPAIDLELGESMMMTAEGELALLVSVLTRDQLEPVYNLEVDGYHTYFVGESRAWVHNAKCDDPGLSDFTQRLEKAGIPVRNTNVEILGENGKILGEVDVITDNALIQYKHGSSSARAVIEQVTEKTEPFVSRPVVTFVNDAGKAGSRTVKGAGSKVLVTNDFDTLVDVIR